MCINYSRLELQVQKYHKATSGGGETGGEKYLQLDLLCVFLCSLLRFLFHSFVRENANVKIKSKMHKIYGVSLAEA